MVGLFLRSMQESGAGNRGRGQRENIRSITSSGHREERVHFVPTPWPAQAPFDLPTLVCVVDRCALVFRTPPRSCKRPERNRRRNAVAISLQICETSGDALEQRCRKSCELCVIMTSWGRPSATGLRGPFANGCKTQCRRTSISSHLMVRCSTRFLRRSRATHGSSS